MVRFEPALNSTSEQTPLIPDRTSSTGRSRSRSHERSRFTPTTLIIPIAIICRFGLMLVTTTTIRIAQIASCRLWYGMNDPSSIPSDGHIPDALCKIPAVNQYFAAIVILLSVGDGVGCKSLFHSGVTNRADFCIAAIVGSSAASFFASRMGRKPVLLGTIMITVVGQCFIMGSQFVQGSPRLEALLFASWAVSQVFSSPLITIFVLNMYIVDVVQAEDR